MKVRLGGAKEQLRKAVSVREKARDMEKFYNPACKARRESQIQVKEAIKNSNFRDFEDCLQDELVIHSNAEYIVICNVKDCKDVREACRTAGSGAYQCAMEGALYRL